MSVSDLVPFFLLRAVLLSSVACLCFALLLRFQRSTSPNLRRVLWVSVLLLGLCAFPYRMELPLLEPEIVPVSVPQTQPRTEFVQETPRPSFHEENRYKANPVVSPFAEPEVVIPVAQTVVTTVVEPEVETVSFFNEIRLSFVLTAIWISGLSLLILRRGVQGLQLHYYLYRWHLYRWEAQREPEFHEAQRQYAAMLAEHGIAPSRLPILWTDDVGPALVFSIWGYRILLPRQLWSELSEEHRRGILRHELSHYLGRDTFCGELLRLLSVLQWFNPCAWFALKKYEEATEWKCDDFAYARHEDGPKELVETLLSVHLSTESLGLHLSSFARINVLSRINRLLESEQTKTISTMKRILYTLMILAFFTAGMVQVKLVAKTQEQTPQPQENVAKIENAEGTRSTGLNEGAEETVKAEEGQLLLVEPEVWEMIQKRREEREREFRKFVQETQPEILKQLDLAEAMLELPEVSAARLDAIRNDLSRSYNKLRVENHEKYRALEATMQHRQMKLCDKIISLYDPEDETNIPLYAVRNKYYAIVELARLNDYSPEYQELLRIFARQYNQWKHPEIKFYANFARNTAAGIPLWELEKRERSEDETERPTFAEFEKVRKDIVEFLATGTDVNSYQAVNLSVLAGKMHERGAMNREQLMETYTLLLKALEGEQHDWIRNMIQEQYQLLSLVGKPVQELSGTLLDGKPLDWNAYKGQTVLVASCSTLYGAREMDRMIAVKQLYSDKPLKFITCITPGESGADRGWVEKAQQAISYPGDIAVTLFAGDTKKLGELVDLKKLNEHFSAHQYEYLGRTFMLIGSDGIVKTIGSDREVEKELIKIFGEPSQMAREHGGQAALQFQSVPKSCSANLYKLMIAMHSYHDVYGTFPPAYTIDDQGRKLHSWRTLLLPFLDQLAFSKEIRMDEPWDSEHNKKFHNTIVAVFQCHELDPSEFLAAERSPMTNYSVVLGHETIFPENGKATSLRENTDGTSNTIAILERATPVHWMEPEEITFEEALKDFGNNAKGIGFPHGNGCNCVFADGSVQFFTKDTPLKNLRAVLTSHGGESITLRNE